MTASEILGERIWRRLVDSGGFVFTDAHGTMTVHWNKGRRCPRELADELRRGKDALRAFVLWRHAMQDKGVDA